LLALGPQRAVSVTACPDPEQLAALVDNRLQPAERLQLLVHLDDCPECYHQWLALAAETSPPSARTTKGGISSKAAYLHSKNVRRFLPLAVAASLLLIMWHIFLAAPATNKKISGAYETAILTGIEALQKVPPKALRFSWERPALQYGFGPAATGTEGSKAFAAGLWHGRKALQPGVAHPPLPEFLAPVRSDTGQVRSWENTEWKTYHLAGKWSILLRTVCLARAPVPAAFWQEQKEIASQLAAQLAERHSTETEGVAIQKALKQLIRLLAAIDTKVPTDRTVADISRELAYLIELSSPRRLPAAPKDNK